MNKTLKLSILIIVVLFAYSCKKEQVPPIPGAISGADNLCPGDSGSVYTIAAIDGISYYLWTVPEDSKILEGQGTTSITIKFGKNSGSICVKSVNDNEVSEPSCKQVTQGGVFDVWCREMDFKPGYRTNATGFSIGKKGYIGTGSDRDGVRYDDLWAFDPEFNTWTQVASLPGGTRFDAVGFSINGKGYIGLGYNTIIYYKDFWEYNPESNQWIRKADFFEGREFSFSFATTDKGYVGSGRNANFNFPKDFWEYNPQTDQWTEKDSVVSRQGAVGFAIGNKGYIGLGTSGENGLLQNDLWEYDTDLGVWTSKADFPGSARFAAAGFAIGNNGYVIGGSNGEESYGDFYEYNSLTNSWTQKSDFPGAPRVYSVGFSIDNKGYVGTGSEGNNGGTSLSDFWVFGQ